ncbi:putative nuclease HARBI1 isoform X1 [Rhagoletis pomonella]|uniref:putative nuclease HARBI1 isoform X1 n=1 Tax=Rhagoletis pomonella TaxID=28610 RepID=UPI0017803D76|nr:putative nuclease HARBI1 isoform X1 [Rhagoletis pomonella]
MRIRFVDASHPGACHDSFIWNNSDLRACFEREYLRGGNNFWLLADAGYPLEPWLLTPHRTPEEGSTQMRFNEAHAKCRNIIERTNGVLKNRWRCILGARDLHYTPEKAAKIINVCCALHNICIHFKASTHIIECEVLEPVEMNAISVASSQYTAVAQSTRNNIGASL